MVERRNGAAAVIALRGSGSALNADSARAQVALLERAAKCFSIHAIDQIGERFRRGILLLRFARGGGQFAGFLFCAHPISFLFDF
jgi:hypothetical protein